MLYAEVKRPTSVAFLSTRNPDAPRDKPRWELSRTWTHVAFCSNADAQPMGICSGICISSACINYFKWARNSVMYEYKNTFRVYVPKNSLKTKFILASGWWRIVVIYIYEAADNRDRYVTSMMWASYRCDRKEMHPVLITTRSYVAWISSPFSPRRVLFFHNWKIETRYFYR